MGKQTPDFRPPTFGIFQRALRVNGQWIELGLRELPLWLFPDTEEPEVEEPESGA